MSNLEKNAALDAHVAQAWRNRRFSDGSKLRLRGGKEQAFVVKMDGVFKADFVEQAVVRCPDGRRIEYGVFSLVNYPGVAVGHTHPRGLEQTPGPSDSTMARHMWLIGMKSYVIADNGAYAVVYDGETYDIQTLAGNDISQQVEAKIVRKWKSRPNRKRSETAKSYACK